MIRILGKKLTDKKYQGLDYKEGVLESKRIFHTMWPDTEKKHVQTLIDYINEQNKDYTFKLDTI